MDELSTHELRGAAFALNLRRAFGAPLAGDLPSDFSRLLGQMVVDPGSVAALPASRTPDFDRLRS